MQTVVVVECSISSTVSVVTSRRNSVEITKQKIKSKSHSRTQINTYIRTRTPRKSWKKETIGLIRCVVGPLHPWRCFKVCDSPVASTRHSVVRCQPGFRTCVFKNTRTNTSSTATTVDGKTLQFARGGHTVWEHEWYEWRTVKRGSGHKAQGQPVRPPSTVHPNGWSDTDVRYADRRIGYWQVAAQNTE